MATLNINNVKETKEENKKEQKRDLGYGITSDCKISFGDNADFKSYGRIMNTTNKDLSLLIKSYFSSILHDLRGVSINYSPNPNGTGFYFDTRFYFQNNAQNLPEGKIRSILDLTKPRNNSNSFFDGQQAIMNAANQKIFTINDATKVILSDFIYGGRKSNGYKSGNWNNHISSMDMMNGINRLNPEYLAFYPNNAHDFYVEVKNIDLKEVIRAIYGNTMIVGSSKKQDSDKETYYKSKSAKYDIIYNKPSKIDTRVFHMNIIQFDPDAVNMLSAGEDIRLFTAPSGFQFFM